MSGEERPGLPWWGWVLLLGGGAMVAFWLVGAAFRTIAWGVRTLFWVVVIGALAYGALALMGRAPGRKR